MRRNWIILGLVGIALGLICLEKASLASPGISWKEVKQIDLSSFMFQRETLQNVIRGFIDQYAVSPEKILVTPSISDSFSTFQLNATSVDTAFQWLLTRYELAVLFQDNRWLILPKNEIWQYQPYYKLIPSSLSLEQILDDLSRTGQITILFDRIQIRPIQVQRNLIYPTVEAALKDLAQQFRWFIQYDSHFHTIRIIEEKLVQTESILLAHIRQRQVEEFFEVAVPLFQDLQKVQIFFPANHILMLKGQKQEIETIFTAVKQLDQAPQVSSLTSDYHFEAIALQSMAYEDIQQHLQTVFQQNPHLQSQLSLKWQVDSSDASSHFAVVSLYGKKSGVEKVADIISKLDQTFLLRHTSVIDRVDLDYLHVNTRKIISEGEAVTNEGAESKLRQFLQELILEEGKKNQSIHMIPDFIGNSIILEGTPEQVGRAKQVFEIWDKPQPLIQIEAHIFETSDTVSRELGVQFSAQGIAGGADAPNVESAGVFTAGITLGPLQTTEAFQVDTLLRFMEAEGRGRVLSRPIVVTTNNIEAEMRSGDIINVKVVIDNQPTLKEIKTGVILRVTPRLIGEAGEEDNRIRLNIFAESSTPIGETVDDIPRINSQSARSEVVVRNGEPFLLGGLIRTNSSESDRGIPLLKDIPLLGYFFKTESISDRFNHILVFVTPTLVSIDQELTLPDFSELEEMLQLESLDSLSVDQEITLPDFSELEERPLLEILEPLPEESK